MLVATWMESEHACCPGPSDQDANSGAIGTKSTPLDVDLALSLHDLAGDLHVDRQSQSR